MHARHTFARKFAQRSNNKQTDSQSSGILESVEQVDAASSSSVLAPSSELDTKSGGPLLRYERACGKIRDSLNLSHT